MIIATATFWWTWVIAIGLLVFFIYIDFKSRPSTLRGIRLIAIILGVLSLLGLYLEPSFEIEAPKTRLVIETGGSDVAHLDSLKELGYKIVRNVSEYKEEQTLSEVAELVVVGDGFEKWEVNEVVQPFQYLPSKSKLEGPFELEITESVINSTGQVDFRLSVSDSIELILSGAGIQTTKKQIGLATDRVSFSVVPTISGYLKYQLDGVRNGDTIFSELVPIKVLERSKTAVLMLGSAPSFEYRFLKNYLTDQGFGVAERTQISKDVFRDSFTNLERRTLRNLSAKTLSDFQLVVLDASSYNRLSKRERNNLQEKLRSGELGLVWTANNAANDLIRTGSVAEGKVQITSGTNVMELNTSSEKLLKSDAKVFFRGNEVGSLLEIGLGKVVMPKVVSSYSLILKGQEDLYAQLWQRILQPAIGAEWSINKISTSRFPRLGEPMSLAISDPQQGKNSMIDSVRLAILEHWYQSGGWESTYWPKKTGWNSVSSSSTKFFVFANSDWPNQKRKEKEARTEAQRKIVSTHQRDQTKMINQPVSKWIFFLIFLSSFGFLWLEQRIR